MNSVINGAAAAGAGRPANRASTRDSRVANRAMAGRVRPGGVAARTRAVVAAGSGGVAGRPGGATCGMGRGGDVNTVGEVYGEKGVISAKRVTGGGEGKLARAAGVRARRRGWSGGVARRRGSARGGETGRGGKRKRRRAEGRGAHGGPGRGDVAREKVRARRGRQKVTRRTAAVAGDRGAAVRAGWRARPILLQVDCSCPVDRRTRKRGRHVW